MIAPLYKYGLFGDEFSLVVGFLVGIGFGFFLERAGFGSAKKLTSQFYLTDLAVFKVMFTAIVTAMARASTPRSSASAMPTGKISAAATLFVRSSVSRFATT